mgnify:CR=1 FL=1
MIVNMLIIWGLVFSGAGLYHCLKKDKVLYFYLLLLAMSILGGVFTYRVGNSANKAYKEALKGNNPYEIKVVYEQQDSTYIPVDTLFIKKEE